MAFERKADPGCRLHYLHTLFGSAPVSGLFSQLHKMRAYGSAPRRFDMRLDETGLSVKNFTIGLALHDRPGFMIRASLAYILTVIVACSPCFCLGSAVQQGGVRTTTCSCCNPCERTGDEAPGDPDTREPDCLCRGAVLQSGIECPNSKARNCETRTAILWRMEAVLVFPTCSAHDDSLSPHFSPHSSGREICALTCVQLL